MRVLYVFATFDAGGPQVRMANLINALPRTYEHHIVAMDDRFGAAQRLDTSTIVDFVSPPPRGWSRGWKTARLIDEYRPDLLVTHNWGSLDAMIARPIGPRLPWIHLETGFEADESDHFKQRRAVARRIVLRRASRVVVPSDRLVNIARTIWKIPDSRLKFIPNGVDVDRFSPGHVDELRNALRIPEGAVVIGTIANLRPVKNPQRLLNAFASCRELNNSYLVFVGDGEMLSAINASADRFGISERVRFVGRQTEVADYHRLFDIFALSSDSEQSPVSVLEAMATGRPVVSTDVGDILRNVSAPNAAFIINRDDPEGFQSALVGLVGDAALRREIGEANLVRAHTGFDLSQMVSQFSELYSSVISESRRKIPKS